MAAPHFTDQDFEEKVLKSSLPVLVDFYADWCGPCKLAAPIIEELAEKFAGKVTIGKVDVDANQMVSMQYAVMSIPTVIMFEDGKEVDRQIGFSGRSMYEKMISKVTND